MVTLGIILDLTKGYVRKGVSARFITEKLILTQEQGEKDGLGLQRESHSYLIVLSEICGAIIFIKTST